MNKKLENRLTMYEGLLSLLSENNEKIRNVGGFADTVTEFSKIVTGIKAKSIEVDSATAGKTSGKYAAEDALVELLLPVCSALYISGRKRKDTKLMELSDTNDSRLRRIRDTELASFGISIFDMASANASEIALYGITGDSIADLKQKAEAYSMAIGERESSLANRKGAREQMIEMFNNADEILNEELDRFMELLRPAETEFYNKYFSARLIKDTGVRHVPVEGIAATTAK